MRGNAHNPTFSFIVRRTLTLPFACPADRHIVAYDDGEVGAHKLWQHDERIRLLTEPRKWPAAARTDAARRRVAAEMNASKRLRGSAKAATAEAAQDNLEASEALTSYERDRAARVKRNRAMLEALFRGVDGVCGAELKDDAEESSQKDMDEGSEEDAKGGCAEKRARA